MGTDQTSKIELSLEENLSKNKLTFLEQVEIFTESMKQTIKSLRLNYYQYEQPDLANLVD